MYSLNYKVTTSACDSEGRLKLYSALQMMQDCSEMWIDSEPGVQQFFAEQNMAQLLASRQVEVIRVPKFKESLTVTTTVYGMKPMYGFRNTFIYDAEGRPCYRTWSMGAFVDKSTGKLKRVDEAVIASMSLEPQQEMSYKERRIILPKEGGIVCEAVKVLRADIDYNRHMNNANYVRVAMELLPPGFEVQGLRVEYRMAARLGDVLVPTVYQRDDAFIVSLAVEGSAAAIIEFTGPATRYRDIYLAGGCFWGTEHYFKQIEGVVATEVGFANGNTSNPTYKEVYTDTTGYAETVHVRYDPDVVSLDFLLQMFFKAIDPTSLNKQGHDEGTRYRTGVYYTSAEDLPAVEKAFAEEQKAYAQPLAVEKLPLKNFYTAEDYHQDYLDKNPDGYCHLPQALFEFARKARPREHTSAEK